MYKVKSVMRVGKEWEETLQPLPRVYPETQASLRKYKLMMVFLVLFFRRHARLRQDLGHSAHTWIILLFFLIPCMGPKTPMVMQKSYHTSLRLTRGWDRRLEGCLARIWWKCCNVFLWIILLRVVNLILLIIYFLMHCWKNFLREYI